MDAAPILAAARACLGTPFRHQGRLPGVGLDCIGLVVAVASALGLPVQDATGYGRSPADGLLEAALDAQLVRADPAPGAIALIRFDGDPQHVGILGDYPAGGLSLIHAYLPSRRVVEHRLDDAWQARIVRCYGFPA